MAIPLRVLILEDRLADAQLLLFELHQAGFDLDWSRVETEHEYLAHLEPPPEIILADFSLPQFDALRALRLVRERGLDIPFLIVSGSIGEDIAVDIVRQGAADFLLKDRLGRLGSAVTQALEQKRLRSEKRQAEEAHRSAEMLFRSLVEQSLVGIHIIQDGKYVYVNPKLAEIFGYTQAEVLALESWLSLVVAEDRDFVASHVSRRLTDEVPSEQYVFRGLRKDGIVIDVEVRGNRTELNGKPAVIGTLIDVTERRRQEAALRESVSLASLSTDVGLALTRGGTLQEMLQRCVESMVNHLDSALARIWTLNEADHVLELQASAGCYSQIDGIHARAPVGNSNIGLIVQERRPHVTNDALTDSRVSDLEWAKREDMIAFAGYPLLIEDRVVGVIEMFARRLFTQTTLDAMAAVANKIALGIERKRSEDSLKRSEQRFRALIENSHDAITMNDSDGIIRYASPSVSRVLGYSPDELIGVNAYSLIHPEDLQRLSADVSAVSSVPGAGVANTHRVMQKDGSWRWIEATGTNLLADPNIGAIIGNLRDITDRKQAEDERARLLDTIEQQRAELQMILDSVPALIFYKDRQYRLVRVNKAHAQCFGLPREQIEGKTDAELGSPYASQYNQDDLNVMTTGEPLRGVIEQFHTPTGTRWLQTEKVPHRDAQGNIVGLVGLALDITQRKQLEEQLRQSQKLEAIGKLAGGVAHDFNNLLTVIGGHSEIILESLRPDDPLHEPIEQIKKAGERAAALTRQLLAFGRKQVLAPVVLDLNALLADVEKMLGRLIGEDVDMLIHPASDLWKVTADAGQMEQVVMNLVINARDAMLQGGQITIEMANVELDDAYAGGHPDARAGQHVLLAVSDTGCGMDKATLSRIFEPFFTTKEIGRGTGLGLATVYGIVKQSGGHIEVYTELGIGTTFKVYLPRGGEVPSPITVNRGVKAVLRGNEVVLLVEDDEGVRGLASLVLQGKGYQVLEATNGEEAQQICEQHSGIIHLLIADVVMPQMSGRQLAERLLKSRPELKVLFMSGYTDDAIVRHGVLNSDMPFIQKPFGTDAFAQKVRETLDK